MKKEKVRLVGKIPPARKIVVNEKSAKDKSKLKKRSQDEKVKHQPYLQKGVKKNTSSNPPPL